MPYHINVIHLYSILYIAKHLRGKVFTLLAVLRKFSCVAMFCSISASTLLFSTKGHLATAIDYEAFPAKGVFLVTAKLFPLECFAVYDTSTMHSYRKHIPLKFMVASYSM